MIEIDLNADLGESLGSWTMGDDEAMLDLVSSANVAAGFHAGDPLTTRRTCEAAVSRGVAVGAHPSYRDLIGFGRRFMDVHPEELEADVLYQLAAVDGIARVAGAEVTYVKPHGALYNAIVANERQAAAVVSAVAAFRPGLAVLGLPGSAFLRIAADQGLRPVAEAFADRAYNSDGTLVSRRHFGSVLHHADEVAERMVRLVTEQTMVAHDGTEFELVAESICIHGDSPGSVAMAAAVRDALTARGVSVKAFTS